MGISTSKLPSALAAIAVLSLVIGAACTSPKAPAAPTAPPSGTSIPQVPTTPTYPSEAEASAAARPVNRTPVPLQQLHEAIGNCLADVSPEAISEAAPGIERCLLSIATRPLGFSARAIGAEGALPTLLIDVANPECMFDEFIAWRSGGQWRLQYLNPLLSRSGIDYRIAPRTLAGEQIPPPREVVKPEGIRVGVITSVANCGSAPQASFLLLALDGDSWRILWDARDTEMADLAHTQVQFLGEGIKNIKARGSSWNLRDPQRNIFHESNPGPHRYFEETWTLKGDEYVLAEKHVQPSAYNTLVEFIYRLSIGNESGAATLVTDQALLDTAKRLALVQNPVGQKWLTNLDRNTQCCGPIHILEGPPEEVVVSFVQQGENWLISDIKPTP